MDSYNMLILLAEVHRDDMLRDAQAQLRPVAPQRERMASIRAIARRGGPGRRVRSAPAVATDPAPGSAPTIPSPDPIS